MSAYGEGYNGYNKGLKRQSCPYEVGEDRKDWLDGWLDAECEELERQRIEGHAPGDLW